MEIGKGIFLYKGRGDRQKAKGKKSRSIPVAETITKVGKNATFLMAKPTSRQLLTANY